MNASPFRHAAYFDARSGIGVAKPRRAHNTPHKLAERVEIILHSATETPVREIARAFRASRHGEYVRLIESEAGAFGLRSGFVVPMALLDGTVVAVSFGGADHEIGPDDQSMLSFIANYAIGSILQRRCSARRTDGCITPREYDCLMRAAEGKTDWECAKILGISKPTVAKHMLSIREKLGAVSKAHVIVLALRQKIIR